MAVHPAAVEFFTKLVLEDPENSVCCDSGEEEATWVSVSHGIYLSIGAAGLHRSLGVKTSFVQSTTMDSWKPKHLKMMELGGNRRFNEFLKEQGVSRDTPVREKYSTRAAQWYREDLNARAEGLEPLAPLAPGTGHLPADTCPSSMKHVLDEVFAVSPCRGSMTRGGVSLETSSPRRVATTRGGIWQASQEESVTSNSQSICKKLSACFRWCSAQEAHSTDPSDLPDSHDSCVLQDTSTLEFGPTLLGSSQCLTAKRLQTFSTGKMVGISSADFPSSLATPEEASRQVEK